MTYGTNERGRKITDHSCAETSQIPPIQRHSPILLNCIFLQAARVRHSEALKTSIFSENTLRIYCSKPILSQPHISPPNISAFPTDRPCAILLPLQSLTQSRAPNYSSSRAPIRDHDHVPSSGSAPEARAPPHRAPRRPPRRAGE